MQTGAATVENSMEFPQKTKNGTAFSVSDSTTGIISKNPETPIQRNLCTPVFIAAQFTIAKFWKQPMYLIIFNYYIFISIGLFVF